MKRFTSFSISLEDILVALFVILFIAGCIIDIFIVPVYFIFNGFPLISITIIAFEAIIGYLVYREL